MNKKINLKELTNQSEEVREQMLLELTNRFCNYFNTGKELMEMDIEVRNQIIRSHKR